MNKDIETVEHEHVSLPDIMGTSYVDYAMSVITDRALPDVRDGLKPVQRRILYAMHEMKNTPDKPHRKCARIVGDTMGKYHPHGDSSIYGALVYMAQDFNERHVLVDGHGNFGSMDGDGAAAMRYTEARLSKLAVELMRDMECDTVDFAPNFDATEKEPTVFPSRFPNLLVNGSQGIAVGMASNMPPHNLREVCAAAAKMIDNDIKDKDTTVSELIDIVRGPDFPTGACILGESWRDVYRTGKGRIEMQAVHHIETDKKSKKNLIVFTELPYQVNKANLVADIAKYAKEKKLDVADVRDETSRDGLRVVVELKRSAIPEMVLNNLLQHTKLRSGFSANMLCLVDGKPMTLDLVHLVRYYLDHQVDVVTRRTKFELNKANNRRHIVEGLLIAIDHIDEVIDIIRNSKDPDTAMKTLMEKFGLTEVQAKTILDLRLRTLTGLEKQKMEDELADLKAKIERCQVLLNDNKEMLKQIKKEIKEIAKKYGEDRRTQHVIDYSDITMEDMIPDEPCVIIRTHLGYIKRMKPSAFRTQKKGGKGSHVATVTDDYVTDMLSTSTHSDIIFFTNFGKVYALKAWQIPESSRTARGSALVSLLKLAQGEALTGMVSESEYSDDKYLMLITKKGTAKRVSMSKLPNIRSNGIIIMKLADDDEVRSTTIVTEDDNVMVTTREGYCAAYPVSLFRAMGRTAMGVKGINLSAGDEVVAMYRQELGREVIVITDKGYSKRIRCEDFSIFKHRGAKGNLCIKAATMKKVGKIATALLVEDVANDLLITTASGQMIKTPIANIPVYSRKAMGTRMINLSSDPDSSVIDMIQTVHEEQAPVSDDDENDDVSETEE